MNEASAEQRLVSEQELLTTSRALDALYEFAFVAVVRCFFWFILACDGISVSSLTRAISYHVIRWAEAKNVVTSSFKGVENAWSLNQSR